MTIQIETSIGQSFQTIRYNINAPSPNGISSLHLHLNCQQTLYNVSNGVSYNNTIISPNRMSYLSLICQYTKSNTLQSYIIIKLTIKQSTYDMILKHEKIEPKVFLGNTFVYVFWFNKYKTIIKLLIKIRNCSNNVNTN